MKPDIYTLKCYKSDKYLECTKEELLYCWNCDNDELHLPESFLYNIVGPDNVSVTLCFEERNDAILQYRLKKKIANSIEGLLNE